MGKERKIEIVGKKYEKEKIIEINKHKKKNLSISIYIYTIKIETIVNFSH